MEVSTHLPPFMAEILEPLPRWQVIMRVSSLGMSSLVSAPDLERSGMGFCVMQAFMDSVDVKSTPGEGTKVTMTKRIGLVRADG